MKKLLYLLLAITLLGCSSNDDSSSNNANNVDYFFEVEFGGVINRVQGNTSNSSVIPLHQLVNKCSGSTAGVQLSISDITADSYVSGQNMWIAMNFDNAQLGSNAGNLGALSSFPANAGFYINEYLESIGVQPLWSFVENGPMSFSEGYYEKGKISNINITDLGTATTYTPGIGYNYGETLKASYEGILYFSSSSAPTADYDIPVPIRIEFNAVRP